MRQERGRTVSSQPLENIAVSNIFTTQTEPTHEESVALEGLEHIFKWASEVVAEGEDSREKKAREKRIRRQVLEVVQKYRDQKLLAKSNDEIAYLQRRVIALLHKLQEVSEENATVKQIMVGQYYALQRIPYLEEEVRKLKKFQLEKEAAVTERRYLMDALAKLKIDRDFLEEGLTVSEEENTRLANLLKESRTQCEELKSRRWWHWLFPPAKKA